MSETALYTDLSGYYDLMCAEIDYRGQGDYAHRLHKLFGHGGVNYLDLACGTGPLVEYFTTLDYSATGLDINEPMLAIAQSRCSDGAFSLQDMSHFTFERKFDLITCFLYSLHYAYPITGFISALQCAYQALNSGGVLCFDAVDKSAIANDQGVGHTATNGKDTLLFRSRWFYSGSGDVLDLHLTIATKNGPSPQVWQDQHRMLAIGVADIQSQLEKIGFDVVILERTFDRIEQWNGTSGNVVFCCTKPPRVKVPPL